MRRAKVRLADLEAECVYLKNYAASFLILMLIK